MEMSIEPENVQTNAEDKTFENETTKTEEVEVESEPATESENYKKI